MNPIDIAVLVIYVIGVVALGSWFNRKARKSEDFMAAGRSLPGWAIGLSILGTFLSSNTFLGLPGKTYSENWNPFVFSLTIPVAAWIAAVWFVPFYRRSGHISAYHHLETRFGPWARKYAVVCYLLTQIARVAIILVGVSLAMQALLGVSAEKIILVTGILVTIYTVLGGIEAVIWTDVIQCLVLIAGALWVLISLPMSLPGGLTEAWNVTWSPDGIVEQSKYSLGSFGASLSMPTFWVVMLYGVFINLGNFGIDQNYVQRYISAKSDTDATRSLWLGAWLYVPVSLMFCCIGTWLFAFYQSHPDEQAALHTYVVEHTPVVTVDAASEEPTVPTPKDVGDRAFPYYIVSALPPGVSGLLIAALLAAAMSTIDSSLNSSATITLCDIFTPTDGTELSEQQKMRILHCSTFVWVALGTATAFLLVDSKSILDTWWKLQGVLTGAILGLFLLGMLSRRTRSADAMVAVGVGVLALAWLTLSPGATSIAEPLRNPLHDNLTIVVGTTLILTTGWVTGWIATRFGLAN